MRHLEAVICPLLNQISLPVHEVQRANFWDFDIAPLAAMDGRFDVRNDRSVPEYLRPVRDEMFAAASAGKPVIVLNALGRKPRMLIEEHEESNADLLQFLKAGIAQSEDSPFEDYEFVESPEEMEVFEQITREATEKAAEALGPMGGKKFIILLTGLPFGGPRQDQWDYEDRKRRNNSQCHYESGMTRLQGIVDKMQRIYDSEREIAWVTVPESPIGNLREQWTRYMLQADVACFRERLREALREGTLVINREGAPDIIDRALPMEFENNNMEVYGERYLRLLRLAQGMLWNPYPMNVVLWGANGTGKTYSMLMLARHLSQLGLGVSYSNCSDPLKGALRPEVQVAFLDQLDRARAFLDQVDPAKRDALVLRDDQGKLVCLRWVVWLNYSTLIGGAGNSEDEYIHPPVWAGAKTFSTMNASPEKFPPRRSEDRVFVEQIYDDTVAKHEIRICAAQRGRFKYCDAGSIDLGESEWLRKMSTDGMYYVEWSVKNWKGARSVDDLRGE